MKQIVINATVAREAGALTILKQLCSALSQYDGDSRFTVFHFPGLELPEGPKLRYIPIEGTDKWIARIRWDMSGLARRCATEGIKPDVALSMQNTGMGKLVDTRQVIYLHQPLPFTPNIRISPISDPKLFFYRHVYKRMIKWTVPKDATIIVQTNWMRDAAIKTMGWKPENVHLLRPDVPVVDISGLDVGGDKDGFHMFFPATLLSYKNHRLLVDAMDIVRRQEPDTFKHIKVYLTLREDELAIPEPLRNNFVMAGYLQHDDMMKRFAAADALLFPSYVETFGLPLLEGATFGLPILAADLPYSRDVLSEYDGVTYLPHTDTNAWATEIVRLYNDKPRFTPLPVGSKSDYGQLIQLLERQ